MSIHIGAEPGQIAPTVLMPGDPLRAKHFAETMLRDLFCFNEVRGMYGYTGWYGDKRISAMGSGMGQPTMAIYINELAMHYGVKSIIRVGTCGAFHPELKSGDLILAMTSSTDSAMNKIRFGGMDYAPAADFGLLHKAYTLAQERGIPVRVGGVFSGDTFYNDDPDWWRLWESFGALATDMETSQLYTLAAKYKLSALSILTVSDSLATGEEAPAATREKGYTVMAEIAMEIAG